MDCRISQRPDFIADRSQFGHWEGDLLIFRRDLGEANVTSLVERKSRYTVMIKNGSRHSRPLIDKIVDTFSPLPAFARQSFTFDRGTEFRGFKALEDGLGARSWFCDPNSPWQKGAVENTNKRIRRFVPSDTDLSAVNQPQLVASPTISIHSQEVPWLPHARRGLHGPFARLRVIPYPPLVIAALGLDSPEHDQRPQSLPGTVLIQFWPPASI